MTRILEFSLLILVFTSVSFSTPSVSYNELPGIISNEIQHLTNGKIPHGLAKTIKKISKIKDDEVANDIFCQTCDLVLTQVINYRRSGVNKESMVDFFRKLCKVFTDWGSEACDGYINIEVDTVLYIIDNKKDLTARRICSIYFQAKSCPDPNAHKWVIPLPSLRAGAHHHRHHKRIKNNPLRILHLTDFHYDPLYTPGSNAACDLPLCCQNSTGKAPTPSKAAGFWGDYRVCDTPWYTITNFTAYLSGTQEKFDFVYYTGDIISHRSWATDKDENTKAIKKLFQHFNETFKDTPVYPILGNHEPHPTDFWSPTNVTPSISTQWMFDLVANEWARWLPNDTSATIRKGGYYTVSLPNKQRIIALNSNVCYTANLWLIHNDEDPYDQLKWLVSVLTKAEKNNETVHILSHIPPGEALCLQQWSNQYHRIVQRFAPIIAAQFNGHTHLDELRLFRDVNNTKKIVSVAFNAGSFTTFVGFNPNYRTYQVDPTSFRVLDYDHYTFNLTQANLKNDTSPDWFKLYSFKAAYGLNNTNNDSLLDLLNRMSKNGTLVQQYFRFQGRESAPQMAQGCDDICRKKLVCAITAVETVQAVECQNIKKIHVNTH